MKKYTYLLAAITISLIASSCGKSYTCECTSMRGQKTYHNFKGEKRAESKCAELGKDAALDGPNCQLLK